MTPLADPTDQASTTMRLRHPVGQRGRPAAAASAARLVSRWNSTRAGAGAVFWVEGETMPTR
jgi:hypothetical protein